MNEIDQKLDFIEECIKTGRFSSARQILDKIKVNSMPRSLALRASNLSRRCGKVQKSLKILNPIVRNPGALLPASEEEVADYAFSLHRIGASYEAKKLLEPILGDRIPSALLFRSIIAFSEWDYELAKKMLEKYIESPLISDYQRLLGQSNLVNSYIYLEDFVQAAQLIFEIEAKAKKEKLTLLLNLCNEQRAEMAVSQGYFVEAGKILKVSSASMKDSGDLVNTWVWKWKKIVESKSKKNGLLWLQSASNEALDKGEWEVSRDIDFYRVKYFNDKSAFEKLVFGTPYKPLLDRLKKVCDFEAPGYYSFGLGKGSDAAELEIEWSLLKAFDSQTKSSRDLNFTDINYKLVGSLLSDFYRPKKWGALFNSLFPEEYYDPFHSVNRLHQILHRFNTQSFDNGLGLKVVGTDKGCVLRSLEKVNFILKNESFFSNSPQVAKILSHPKFKTDFCLNDLSSLISGNKRSHQRLIKKLIETGKVVKIGSGRASRYKISS